MMSAIFGIYALQHQSIDPTAIQKMKQAYGEKYSFDCLDHRSETKAAFGTGMQWVTPESIHEALPYFDGDHNLFITADAIIDNRQELLQALAIPLRSNRSVTDSEIILYAYVKWGEDCVSHLIGNFAFAIWDKSKDVLFIARDHLGTRTVVYYKDQQYLYFATTPSPLLTVVPDVTNESWFNQYLLFPYKADNDDPYMTRWKGIHHLPPAHTLTVKNGTVDIKQYWELERKYVLKLPSDEAYAEAFRSLLATTVQASIRTYGEVGIQLSGGLDSSSVAAFAAPQLQEDHKGLFSYTHVPLSTYVHKKQQLVNERPLVEKLVEKYPSIIPTWVENKHSNAFTTIDEWLEIFEEPTVFFANTPWLMDIHKQAATRDIKVLLTGQHGNGSISFGELYTYYVYLRKHHKWARLLKEVHYQKKIRNVSLLRALKFVLSNSTVSRQIQQNNQYFSNEFAQVFQPSHWENRAIKAAMPLFSSPFDIMKGLNDPTITHARGAYATHTSLAFNHVRRDPSGDVRMLEFMASLPFEQFVSKGISKRILRSAMKDLLPREITDIRQKKGIQSADWMYRLKDDKGEIIALLQNSLGIQIIKRNISQCFIGSIKNRTDEVFDHPYATQLILRMISIGKVLDQKIEGG